MSNGKEISRRLKAARWLAGGLNRNGKPTQLSTTELAAHPILVENKITKNQLEDFEQLKVTPPPMKLEQIARALGVSSDWFSVELISSDDPAMRFADRTRMEARRPPEHPSSEQEDQAGEGDAG